MSLEIRAYRDSLLDEVLAVYNRETAGSEFIVPMTPEIFRERIGSKRRFAPEGCLLALEDGKAVGLALSCDGPDPRGTDADPAVGTIAALLFPADRLHAGRTLLDRCLDRLRARGARTVHGWASSGGYPFLRGLYMGLEPVCATDYVQAWTTFMAAGFAHHQQSVNYLGRARELPARADLAYVKGVAAADSPWAADSWRGLRPRRIAAQIDGEQVGQIRWADMPLLSARRGVRTAGIAGLSVAARLRRRGIASSLLSKVFEQSAAEGIEEVLVGTTVENAAARRTYEKADMKIVAYRSGTRTPARGGRCTPGP